MAPPITQRITPKKQAAFLAALALSGNVLLASKKVRASRDALYAAKKRDPAFAEAWDKALDAAIDLVLEPEAMRRAVQGVDKPVYQGGELVGHVREYSDTLLIFLLKGGKPDKYKERYAVEHRGTIDLAHRLQALPGMSDDDLADLAAEAEAYANSH